MTLSIRARIVLYVALPILVISIGIFWYALRSLSAQAASAEEMHQTEMARHHANLLNVLLGELSQVPRIVGPNMVSHRELTEEDIYKQLQNNLQQNAFIYGSAMAFEPYAYDKSRRLYSPYVFRDGQAVRRMDIASEAYDYTAPEWEWWNAPREKGLGVWTAPYFDEGAGNILMSTYSFPLRKDGKPWAVMTVDIPLDALQKFVRQLVGSDQDFFILDRDGTYIHHPDSDKVLAATIFDEAATRGRQDIADVATLATSGESGLTLIDDWMGVGKQWVLYAPIEATGWTYVGIVPEERVLEGVSKQVASFVWIGVLGLMACLFCIWIFSELVTKMLIRDRSSYKPARIGLTRTLFPILFAAILLTAVGWWTYDAINRSTENSVRHMLLVTLSAEITAVTEWMEEQQAKAALIASDSTVRNQVQQLVRGEKTPGEIRQLLEAFGRTYGFTESLILDRSGRILYSRMMRNIGEEADENLRNAMRTLDRQQRVMTPPVLSPLMLIDNDGRPGRDLPSMFAGASISMAGQEPFAYLFLRLRPEHEFSSLLRIAQLGETGETYAFNDQGMLVSESRFNHQLRAYGLIPNRPDARSLLNVALRAPEESMVDGYRPTVPHGALPLTKMAASALQGDSGVDVKGYRDYRGELVVGSWEWLEDYDIGLATEIDADEAFQSLYLLRMAFVGIFSLLVLAGIFLLVAYFTIQRTFRNLAFEMERSEGLLLNVLPRPIAERLKSNRGIIADGFREVTVLFADLVGFTPLSSSRKPEEVVRILNALFNEFDAISEKHHLEKIKTIGDAYMVAGGIPEAYSDHAVACVDMAFEMLETVERVRDEWQVSLDIRIGINTGPVVAGVIGSRKFAYDIWGDTVNIASRLESHGEPGTIQISESTYYRIKDEYEVEPMGTINLKGKGPTPVFHVLRRKPSVN